MARARPVGLCVLVLVSLTGSAAQAEDSTKSSCAAAYEQGQRQKQRGSLRAARQDLLLCSREPCPSVMHADCAQWLADVDAMMPSVVVHARSGQQDLTEAQVLADGALVAERLDGMPLPLDPGQHTLVVRWQGKTAERQVLLSAGEKARAVHVVWATEAPQQPPGPEPGQGAAKRPVPWPVYAAGGVSLVAFGTFALFAANAQGRLDDLDRAGCKPFCDPSDVEKTDRAAVVADVALVVGVATAALAGVLFVTRPTVSHASAR